MGESDDQIAARTSRKSPNVGLTAAFETKMSNCPYLSMVSLNRRCRSSDLLTWQTVPWISNFSFRNSASAFWTLSDLRLEITTRAPSRANRRAMAKPILVNQTERSIVDFSYDPTNPSTSYPSVEAVTQATFPARRCINEITDLKGRGSRTSLRWKSFDWFAFRQRRFSCTIRRKYKPKRREKQWSRLDTQNESSVLAMRLICRCEFQITRAMPRYLCESFSTTLS